MNTPTTSRLVAFIGSEAGTPDEAPGGEDIIGSLASPARLPR